jgi:hypothetical protein
LLELWTGFCLQSFSPHQHSPHEFCEYFDDSFENNNLVFFRTRNSVRLETAGLISNKIYLISRTLTVKEGVLVEFLELEKKAFKGKYSKASGYWDDKGESVAKLRINLGEGRESYIALQQILGISREIIILHNTEKYNQNWVSSSSPKLKHTFKMSLQGAEASHAMISLHFNRVECRTCAYLICAETCELVSGSFKEKKAVNFIAAIIDASHSYTLFVYC